MSRQVGGFGFLILVIVVVVVLLLTAKAWQSVLPSASDAVLPDVSRQLAPSSPRGGESPKASGQSIAPGKLPNLNQMGQSTDAHTRQIQEAAEAAD